MASLRDIKKKIKSAKNIGQVTKALEMVSAVKMRRAQLESNLSRPYALEIASALAQLQSYNIDSAHPLLNPPKNPQAPTLVVLVAPDKGLAGPLITNLLKQILLFKQQTTGPIQVIVWGKKAASMSLKLGLNIIADVTPEKSSLPSVQIALLSRLITDAYISGSTKGVYIIYTEFISTLVQQAKSLQFLPLAPTISSKTPSAQQIQFEPDPVTVQTYLVRHYLEIQLAQILKDSIAAEHSARMVAMKKARDNAADIVSDYQLLYNKTRQEKITSEIADLTANIISL